MNRARFTVVSDTSYSLVIRDTGHRTGKSVTNDADAVVAELAERLGNRRLYYYDSEGRLDELVVRHGEFAGFRPGDSAAELDTTKEETP